MLSRIGLKLSSGFWFFPTLLTISALILAPALVQLDERLQAAGRPLEWLNWIYGGQMPGARRLLSAIAASMMAIATVMFSSQTTALTFIGQEYGSRLLRNFLADSRNQIVFGTYVSTFVYALMVLRTIHKDPDDAQVPYVAVSFGITLAVASIGVLIYSMFHTSKFLQASTLIDFAAQDLESIIARLTGESPERERDRVGPKFDFEFSGVPLQAERSGYIEYLKEARLVRLCRQHDARVRIDHRIGDFVVQGMALGAASASNDPAGAWLRKAAECIVLKSRPTIEHDVRYAAYSLVQLALRAVSTDRNDTVTATMCMDRMGSALCLLARRAVPDPFLYDSDGTPRVKIVSVGFASVLDTCFRPLREYPEISPSLLAHMLKTLRTVEGCTTRPEDLVLIRQESARIREIGCQRGMSLENIS